MKTEEKVEHVLYSEEKGLIFVLESGKRKVFKNYFKTSVDGESYVSEITIENE
jgi:hypothetical protein